MVRANENYELVLSILNDVNQLVAACRDSLPSREQQSIDARLEKIRVSLLKLAAVCK